MKKIKIFRQVKTSGYDNMRDIDLCSLDDSVNRWLESQEGKIKVREIIPIEGVAASTAMTHDSTATVWVHTMSILIIYEKS